jgi:hypothetical protein
LLAWDLFRQAKGWAKQVGGSSQRKHIYFEGGNPVAAWLSKEQAQAIQIHKPPNKVKILGLNKQLLDAALSFPESRQSVAGLMIGVRVNQDADAEAYAAFIRTMEDLVRRGASINESGALQSVVANKESMMVVKILLRLGGDVNHRDELGTTPLHVAAGCQRYKDTKLLNIC